MAETLRALNERSRGLLPAASEHATLSVRARARPRVLVLLGLLCSRPSERALGLQFDSLSALAPPPPPQRGFSQLYEDAARLAGDGGAAPDAVISRAQRLLLSTGGFDVEAATRDAQELQLKV
jgi:hypothetical protein